MENKIQLPLYLKIVMIMIGLFLFVNFLHTAGFILIPLTIAGFFSILVLPVCRKMEQIKIPRGWSVILSMILVLLLFFGVLFFLIPQLNNILKVLPQLEGKLIKLGEQSQQFFAEKLDIQRSEQIEYLKTSIQNLASVGSSFIGTTIDFTSKFFQATVIASISFFFILYYRSFFVNFLFKVFGKSRHEQLNNILQNVKKVVQNYIGGLLIVMFIVAVLNSLGLYILGIQHAIFFGVFAALLTIIPYFGIMFGSIIAILFALITKDSIWYPIGVFAVFMFVQFIEGNFITPNIVGTSVSINPFVALIGLFVGGNIWGAAGMILFLPLLAIMKVIFDEIDSLKPYGYLLGNPTPRKSRWLIKKKKPKFK